MLRSVVKRGVDDSFFESRKKKKLVAVGGQQRWSGLSKIVVSWNVICTTKLEGSRWCQELCKWAICHRDNLQKREGKRGRGGEWKRGTSCHTRWGLRDPSSPPLQQIWTLSFFLALTWVRGTPKQLHASFQGRLDCIKSDGFFSRNPKSLNREREKKGGPLDLLSFSNRGSSSRALLGLNGPLHSSLDIFMGCSKIAWTISSSS